MPPLNIAWVRSQFPSLNEKVDGKPALFFDAPGGTQVPQRVIEAMSEYLTRSNSNTHGAFVTSRRTDETIAEAHVAVADLLGCHPEEIVFGPNMTTLTFGISRAIGRELEPGDEIVVTYLDHDADVAPWRALEEHGAVIRVVDLRLDDCTLDMESFRRQLSPRTKLVAAGYASNAVGTINDVQTIVREAHGVGALAFVDAVHYAPHGPIDVRELDCDFLACSAYKFFGPHLGVLYGKAEHLKRLRPYKVRPASDEIPWRWETGTQNHEGLAGLIAGLDYLEELGRRYPPDNAPQPEGGRKGKRQALLNAMHTIKRYERWMAEHLVQSLLAIPGVQFYGIRDTARFDCRTPTVAIRLGDAHPRAVAEYLAHKGIFVWDGNYYAMSVTERLGVEESGGMVRIGLVHYNTVQEVDRLLEALRQYPR
jgi:cysteine desulfurase family protein (TIGR01976 family)